MPGGDRFRPDLEGLRAIAVILVLLFHARVPGFDGGYVGVDVFFVLSGFLITGLILSELLETGTVSLAGFYARRARRLLPAAALALAAAMVVSALVLSPVRTADVAADAAASALYAANLHFAVQATDYLQAELAPSPLLHYWSLGVEEQFYLFWPALLLAVAWLARRPVALLERIGLVGIVAAAIGLVGVGSLVLSIWLTERSAPWAFFSLPTRAWELALGGIVAVVAVKGIASSGRVATALVVGGLALIGVAGHVFTVDTAFPGTAALLPTVGTALVIAGGLGGATVWPSRLLTLGPVRYIGRISYSLYLWHWPILVLPAAAAESELPLPVRVGLALCTFPVAAASQHWIEEPIRRGRLVGQRPRSNLAFAGALAVVLAVSSLAIGGGGVPWAAPATSVNGPADLSRLDQRLALALGPPSRAAIQAMQQAVGVMPPSPAPGNVAGAGVGSPGSSPTPAGPVPADVDPSPSVARADLPRVYEDKCVLGYDEIDVPSCEYGDRTSPLTVVLFGDSHAAQWFPALERLADANDWRLFDMTKIQCAAIDHDVWDPYDKRAYPECTTWRANALAKIAELKPDLVVVTSSYAAQLTINDQPIPSGERLADWSPALERTLRDVASRAKHVLLIGDTPRSHGDPPACVSGRMANALACATPAQEATDAARLQADAASARKAGVAFLDPTAWLCPSQPCPAVIGGVLVFRDGDHMTATFAAALAPYLAAVLPPLR